MTKQQKKPATRKPAEGLTFLSKLTPLQLDLLCIAALYVMTLVLFRGIVFTDSIFASEGDSAAARSYADAGRHLEQAEGVDVVWMPFFFSGMPTFGNVAYVPHNVSYIQTAVVRVLNVLFLNGHDSWLVVHYLLSGIFMFLLLRVFKFSRIPALFAAVVFMLAPFGLGLASEGHGSKLMAVSYIPLVFLVTHLLFERRDILSFGLMAAAIGTLLLTNHMQIVYYALMVIAFYLFYHIVMDVRSRNANALWKTLLFGGAVLVGFAISAYIYLSVYEYAQYSIRGGGTTGAPGGLTWEYATNWSFNPVEILTLLIPSAFGFQSPYYWGTMPFTNSTVYLGILPLLLAVLALAYKRTGIVIFMSLLTVLAILISFGKHFSPLYELLFNVLPFFNKFRAPQMILHLLPFTVGILAAQGLEFLLATHEHPDQHRGGKTPSTGGVSRISRSLLYVAGGLGALLIIAAMMKSSLFQSLSGFMFGREGELELYRQQYGAQGQQIMSQLRDARFDMLWKDFVKFVVIGVLSIGLVILFLNRKIGTTLFVLGIFVTFIADVVIVINKAKFIDPKPRTALEERFQPDSTIAYLRQQKGLFRVLPLGRNPATNQDLFMDNTYAYHGISSMGGYSPAKLKIYQTMLDSCLYRGSDPEFPLNMNIINMLDGEYIVVPGRIPEDRFQLVNTDQAKGLLTYRNPAAFPRAWFVDDVIAARNENQVFRTLNSSVFDARHAAVVENAPSLAVTKPDSASAEVTGYTSRLITLKTYTSSSALLVLSEVYYPAGWKATIDGKETEIFKTNYVLRSIVVPAGNHEVIFSFEPTMYELGYTLTRVGWGVAFLSILIGLWQLPIVRRFLKKGEEKPLT